MIFYYFTLHLLFLICSEEKFDKITMFTFCFIIYVKRVKLALKTFEKSEFLFSVLLRDRHCPCLFTKQPIHHEPKGKIR